MATTQNQLINRSDRDRGWLPVAAGAVIPSGTLYFVTAAGFATSTATGNKFAGICVRGVDNSPDADGETNVEGWREGQFVLEGAGFSQSDVGRKVYAVDNIAVSTTSVDNIYLGKITQFVSATQVKVDIDALAEA